jgi:hypothetical protein
MYACSGSSSAGKAEGEKPAKGRGRKGKKGNNDDNNENEPVDEETALTGTRPLERAKSLEKPKKGLIQKPGKNFKG